MEKTKKIQYKAIFDMGEPYIGVYADWTKLKAGLKEFYLKYIKSGKYPTADAKVYLIEKDNNGDNNEVDITEYYGIEDMIKEIKEEIE